MAPVTRSKGKKAKQAGRAKRSSILANSMEAPPLAEKSVARAAPLIPAKDLLPVEEKYEYVILPPCLLLYSSCEASYSLPAYSSETSQEAAQTPSSTFALNDMSSLLHAIPRSVEVRTKDWQDSTCYLFTDAN